MISCGDPIHCIIGSLSGTIFLFSMCFFSSLEFSYALVYRSWWLPDFIICITCFYSLGTLGYVMSELENGKPFSQVVNAAKSLGYTEPGNKQPQGVMSYNSGQVCLN